MPSAFDRLDLFSFGGDLAPFEKLELIGKLRDHVHEYSHQDGGDPEKLGRALYVIRASLNFASNKYKKYPGLWPNTINRMMQRFELGETHDLVFPTKGVIQAYAYGWTRTVSAKIRSGEMMQVEFREDSTNLPLPISVTAPAPATLSTGASALAAKLAAANLTGPDIGLFTALQNLIASIVAIRDTADLAGNLVAQKIDQAINMCRQLDGAFSLQDPSKNEVVQALHALWAQLVSMKNDLLSRHTELTLYTTPARMTIQAVSGAIFGDTSHVPDLLALNTGAFADPSDIRRNTQLVYYPNTPGK